VDKIVKYITATDKIDDEKDDDFESSDIYKYHIAELIMLLFFGDIYQNYLEKQTQESDHDDTYLHRLMIVTRASNQHMEDFINSELLPVLTPGLKSVFIRAFKQPATYSGIFHRIDAFRNAFLRVPATKIKPVFVSPRDYVNINKCVHASLMDDEKQAMEELKHITIKTPQIRNLVKHFYETISKNKYEPTISNAVTDTQDSTTSLSHVIQEKEHTPPDTIEHKELKKKEEKLKQDIKDVTNATTDKHETATKADVVEIASQVNAQTQQIKAFTHQEPDPEQKSAIFTTGHAIISAGAGSGKTSTLTTKVGYLIKDKHVDPSTIFVTTFGKEASKEMSTRIKNQVGDYPDMFVGTMHAFSLKSLEKYGSPEYKQAIINTQKRPQKNKFDLTGLIKSAMEELSSVTKKEIDLSSGQAGLIISNWKYELIEPDEIDEYLRKNKDDYEQEEYMILQDAANIYKIFETLKGRHKIEHKQPFYSASTKTWNDRVTRAGDTPIVDFDDMLCDFLKLLKEKQSVKEMFQKKYKHILLDEAQDCNTTQFEIFDLLTEKIDDTGDAWLIGDVNQALYSFRGSKPNELIDRANNPKYQLKTISTNYRCAYRIVDIANKVIANNTKKIPMLAVANRKTEGVVEIKRSSIENLANESIDEIVNTLEVDPIKAPSDFAVIARTNNELNDFEASCIVNNVPYTRRGGLNFFNRREIKMILNYMVLAISEDIKETNAALLEVYDYPNRFFGGKFGNHLKTFSNYVEALNNPQFTNNFEHFKKPNIQKLYSDIMNLKNVAQSQTTQDLLQEILNLSGAKESIRSFLEFDSRDEDAEDGEHITLGGVSYLIKMMQPDQRFPSIDPTKPKQFFLKVQKMKEVMKDLNVKTGGVVLQTIHVSKGLEYSKVFAVMKAPNEKFIKNMDQFEEERRMAYVQITRARDELTILSSKYDAKGNSIPVSPFITETGISSAEYKNANDDDQDKIRKTSSTINRVLNGVR